MKPLFSHAQHVRALDTLHEMSTEGTVYSCLAGLAHNEMSLFFIGKSHGVEYLRSMLETLRSGLKITDDRQGDHATVLDGIMRKLDGYVKHGNDRK